MLNIGQAPSDSPSHSDAQVIVVRKYFFRVGTENRFCNRYWVSYTRTLRGPRFLVPNTFKKSKLTVIPVLNMG